MRIAVGGLSLLLLTTLAVSVSTCGFLNQASAEQAPPIVAASPPPSSQAQAIFAGGCFWCMETAFEGVEGVASVTSGYTGGPERAPTYRQVSSGRTGHLEAVRVVYDPSIVTYAQLAEIFWVNVDPTQDNGQFCDRGAQYRSAIFYSNAAEHRIAEASKGRAAARLGRPIVTEVRQAATFWIAEAYHQDYYRTHTARYQSYRLGCGRDARLRQLWGPSASH